MSQQPHVLIIGAGAIGSFYGAILKRAGCTVSAVVRSEYEAIRDGGFQFESPLGDISWRPDHLYRDGDQADSQPDYVILATKVLPNSDRAALIRPWLGEDTGIVLIQNGLDIERELAEAFPNNPIISCLAFIAVSRVAPGQIKHNAYGRLVMGRFPEGIDEHCSRLRDLFVEGGIDIKLTEQVVGERWLKCVWNTPFNPLSVLANGADTYTILDTPGGEQLIRDLMAEVMAVAEADGHPLPSHLPDSNIAGTRKMPAYKNSMALDYLNDRPIELDAILGNVVAIAHRLNVPVPRLETVLVTLRMRQG
ncbi:ketopantoate reductase family protein [Alloalcanivorax xenomutans]|jgi:2-dehydropantoate 2-reductase|uniref:2-dehydropantoate 2-reductase n=1 Tax=Alloalcanivorax xenomutans TaxID=1094342 RepID=A0A9Q3ZF70_9GAMM|nr:2-dehydropantoate 2-reductase [Alloalcanivorax xenomutans]ERS15100.1 2-dehydropantoate 2-reductase [Alcanivorax sp. PN-3]KYZ87166.1 2-dehydropantoate 2-reductase [Alcanivorax sp. KX64203]ARB45354.1 2-dehydropantoate 2-reductase [Alloalcanivorax xenomutans]MCE7507614.1 2-dehydropantoate 2-reductase [Alloalcanivorax xenomutans]MCE7524696.1 2-dehydropantoate 2-reductase [Alloalcanivorax xenomutans]|tara:strand:+ start:876 stop:1796 length:921 start_codon:yes stop_codon:yes gene_type:complete